MEENKDDRVEIDPAFIAKMAQKGRESFFFFCTAILGFDKVTKKIHRPLCKDLEQLEKKRRMMIMLPRDWYKTTLGSISYPIWRAVNNPEIRVLLVQNTYTNATSKLGAIKQIFEKNDLFRSCYPEILPKTGATWSKDSLCVDRKGAYPESTFEGAGTNTEVVSRHYDLIIEDDTVAPNFDHMTGEMMQPTRADIEKCIGWHKLAHPLLIEPGESQILVVGTRWIEDDLLEWIMKNEKHYHIIQRAVREDENGKPDPKGTITWPETDEGKPKFNKQILDEIEAALGPYMFSTLYLNLPTAAANMLFKPQWINYYEKPPNNLIVFTSCDLASAKLDSSTDPDFSITLTVGVNPDNGHIYVLDYDRDRFNPGEHIDSIFKHYRTHKFMELILEAIGYQRTLGYWLEQRQLKTNVHFPVTEVTAYSNSKDHRIRGLQPYFANNKIFIREHMVELENELVNFPYGRHDDLIDALSAQIPAWTGVIDESAKRKRSKKRKYGESSGRYIIDMIEEHRKKPHRDYLSGIGNLEEEERPVLFMQKRDRFTFN